MPRPIRTITLAALLAMAAAAAGRAAGPAADPVASFLGPEGCVIGPETEAAAGAAGISAAMLADFAARAEAAPGSHRTGEWLLVGPGLCAISFPPIESELTLDDPEVKASFSAMDEYADLGDIGCFLNGDKLVELLQQTRGWSRERAHDARMSLIGAGVQSGDIVFYSDDPLRMPPGFGLAAGACGEAPGMEEARASHALLMRHLDAYLRDVAAATECREGESPVNSYDPLFLNRLTEGRYRNAWGFLEVMLMAIAAGWYEGESLTEKGMPRPPLCHFGD